MSRSSSATTATTPVEWLDRTKWWPRRSAPTSISAGGATWAPATSIRSNSRRAWRGRGDGRARGSSRERAGDGLPGRASVAAFRVDGRPPKAVRRQRFGRHRHPRRQRLSRRHRRGDRSRASCRSTTTSSPPRRSAPGSTAGSFPAARRCRIRRFVVYYFRPTVDGRLIFGGGETYSRRRPPTSAAFVRRHLAKVYPQLATRRDRLRLGRRRWRSLSIGCRSSAGCGRASMRRRATRDRASRWRRSPERSSPTRSSATPPASTVSRRFPVRAFPAANFSVSRRSSPA